GEHTWGSWETFSKPHSTFSHSHWNAKAGFAYDAWDHARDLAVEGLHRLIASGTASATEPTTGVPADGPGSPHVVVTNPTELERCEPVEVEVDGAQRTPLLARVPAFGVARLDLPAPERTEHVDGEVERACGQYRVRVSISEGGIVSLVDTETGRELVDRTAGPTLGAVVVASRSEEHTSELQLRFERVCRLRGGE